MPEGTRHWEDARWRFGRQWKDSFVVREVVHAVARTSAASDIPAGKRRRTLEGATATSGQVNVAVIHQMMCRAQEEHSVLFHPPHSVSLFSTPRHDGGVFGIVMQLKLAGHKPIASSVKLGDDCESFSLDWHRVQQVDFSPHQHAAVTACFVRQPSVFREELAL